MSATETPEVPLPDVPPLGNAPPLDFHWLKVALAQNLLGRVVPQPRAIAPHSGSPKKKSAAAPRGSQRNHLRWRRVVPQF